jgi:hypothetical protein
MDFYENARRGGAPRRRPFFRPVLEGLEDRVLLAAATQLVVSNLSATSITAGGTVSFKVTAEDSTNNPVTNYTGTVKLTSTDSNALYNAAALPATYTFVAGDNGAHSFTVTLETAGSKTVALTDQANSSLTATAGPITVSAGVFNKFVLAIQGGNTLVAGNIFLLTAQASDQFGNPVTSYSGPATITAAASPPDPQVNFSMTAPVSSSGFAFMLGTLQTAGSYTLTAGGANATVVVTPTSPDYFTVTAPSQPFTATTGTSFNVTVKAFDRFGNLDTGYTGTISLGSTDPAASSLVASYHFLTSDIGAHTFPVTLNSSTLANGIGTIIIARDTTATTPPVTGFSAPITVEGLLVPSGGFQKTATGFTVTFSKPFVPADLTLYGSNTTTVPDVTMVGADLGNGPFSVPGTLFLDPTTPNTIVFKATSAFLLAINQGIGGSGDDSVALPDDTYTVTLVSGSGNNGFVDALNSHLDGLGNGTSANFKTTFATTFQDDAHANANPAPVLSIPDFARGPDGATTITVPNNPAPSPSNITLYDESVSGDLSNNQAAPTPLTLAPGTNAVKGTVGGADMQDWIMLHVPTGMTLSSIVLASYVPGDSQGFTGFQRGTSFVNSPFTASSYVGYAHFGIGATNGNLPPTNLVGADLLPIMADPNLAAGSQGFTPPLASGDYTFLIQQQGPATGYQFNFVTSSTTPNTGAHGIPITLYNAAAVKDAAFTLTYNPQILTPSAGGTGDSPVGSSFTMGTITSIDSTHSSVGFTYHNATAHSGTVILGDILATVPNSAAAIYKTKELLTLSGITVTGSATVQAANGIHVDAYLGDVHVTALPAIDASDALDAQKVASGAASGFSAYTLLDPAIIGNVGQNISVDAAAVTNLFSKAAHLAVPRIPSLPSAVISVSVNGADPTLSLVGSVRANGIVSVAVMLDHPHPAGSTGMTEAHLSLTYDPSVLSVSASDITLGSIPGAGWRITSEVDAATGQIGINLFNLEGAPITATQAGSLVNIDFHVVPGAVVPATSVQLVTQATANGRRFVTEVDDNQGPLTLSPGVDRSGGCGGRKEEPGTGAISPARLAGPTEAAGVTWRPFGPTRMLSPLERVFAEFGEDMGDR